MSETSGKTAAVGTFHLVGGWSCRRCTYYHHAPGTRCVMCQELRMTRQDMRDFVAGKSTATATTNTAAERDDKENQAFLHPADESTTKLSEASAAATESGEAAEVSTVIVPAAALAVARPPSSRPQQLQKQQQPLNPYARKPSASTAATTSATTSTRAWNPPFANQASVSVGAAVQEGAATAGPVAAAAGPSDRSAAPNDTNRATAPSAPPVLQPVNAALMKKRPLPSNKSNNKATNKPPSRAQASLPPVMLPYQPGPVPLCNTKEWCFPIHPTLTKRQYQLEICQSALLSNTLVSLPTGLGKTLIAAVVLYNYYTWFPKGKILFLAPTLPLVHQQVQACFQIMGIPVQDTAVLTGKLVQADRTRIWQERRVFFCTPQTVLRDWEAGSADPTRIVCVVFDEAHKATGDYAYVKIVQHLQAAQAKARLVGLSATPGPNLKAIQGVVDALQINKLEARHDSDPDVAQYLHAKQMELVVVPQVDAARHVQGLVCDLIAPLLERLRSQGCASRLTGLATLTPYQVLKAQQEYAQRPDANPGVSSIFYAVHALVQWQSDLHQHGLGLVRTKLQRLRTERQRGVLASITKSKAFETLWQAVLEATTTSRPNDNDDDNSDETQQQQRNDDILRNNPKLIKLQEILLEHFQRARACHQSSRAICFSQFRDSVQEIVSVLQQLPADLVRARHFIGQGKGSRKKQSAASANTKELLLGMKQSEQQQVLQEFRQDVYNVLVCTCIAEEGLDVGEVDLIVQFDTLRSPIRTIQRTGRTGRKRNGRVVCLVAEGQEERTLRQSQQAERTLHHALKNPKSFTVFSTQPMFPPGQEPVLVERTMAASTQFHASQVEGHDGARRKRRVTKKAAQKVQKSAKWRLTATQQERLVRVLGSCPTTAAVSKGSWSSLRRRFVAARSLSACCATQTPLRRRRRHWQGGRTLALLRQLETNHPVTKSRRPRKDAALEAVFSLDPSSDPGPAVSLAWVDANLAGVAEPALATTTNTASWDSVPRNAPTVSTARSAGPPSHALPVAASLQQQQQQRVAPFKPLLEPLDPTRTTGTGAAPRIVQNGGREQAGATHSMRAAPATHVASKVAATVPIRPTATTSHVPNAARTLEPARGRETVHPGRSVAPVETVQESRARNVVDSGGMAQSSVAVDVPPAARDGTVHSLDTDGASDTDGVAGSVGRSMPAAQELDPANGMPPPTNGATRPIQTPIGTHVLPTENGRQDGMAPLLDDDEFYLQPASSSEDDEASGEEQDDDDDCKDRSVKEMPTSASVGGNVSAMAQSEMASSRGERVDPSLVGQTVDTFVNASALSSIKQLEQEPVAPENPVDPGVCIGDNHEEDVFQLGTQESSSDESTVEEEQVPKTERAASFDDSFCLAPPEPSSDEESVDSVPAIPRPVHPSAGMVSEIQLVDGGGKRQSTLQVDSPDEEKRNKTCRTSERSADESSPSPPLVASLPGSHSRLPKSGHDDVSKASETPRQAAAGAMSSSAIDVPSTAEEDGPVKVTRKRPKQRVIFADDSPLTESLSRPSPPKLSRQSASLTNTPEQETSPDEIVCAVCHSPDSLEEDPIILCDGPGSGQECDLAVHSTCYSVIVDPDPDKEWRCDPCDYFYRGNKGIILCSTCMGDDGALKRISPHEWRHPSCRAPRTGLADPTEWQETKRARRAEPARSRKNRLEMRARQFFAEEAGINSDEDAEGDEGELEDILEIEREEEAHGSFINDSTQSDVTTLNHRAMDNERDLQSQVGTPVFYRRIGPTPPSAADSEKGLGGMHFIRSVLEHHRNGGDANEIEQMYRQVQAEEDSSSE